MTSDDDVTWTSVSGETFDYANIYVNRPLTWWERFKMRWLRRPDPRIVFVFGGDDDE